MSLLSKGNLVVPAQTYFPGSPYDGQTFIHTTTGRKIEYTYDALTGLWMPKRGYGTIETYVDALGTDDLNHGYGTGADAFQTIAYAYRALPPIMDGTSVIERNWSALIHVGAGVYNENMHLSGTPFPQQCLAPTPTRVAIQGELTVISNGVATGGTQGAGAVVPSVTGAFIAGSNEGKLIKFTSGANDGLYRIIGFTTAGAMYLNGAALSAAPINGDTYTIYDWGTQITGWFWVATGSLCIELYDMYVNPGSHLDGYTMAAWASSYWNIHRCRILNNNIGIWTLCSAQGSLIVINDSYMEVNGARFGACAENCGHMQLNGVKFLGDDTISLQLLQGTRSGAFSITSCEFEGMWAGISISQSAIANIYAGVNTFMHGSTNPGFGLYAFDHGQVKGQANVTFDFELDNATADAVITNTQANAASFSWIG